MNDEIIDGRFHMIKHIKLLIPMFNLSILVRQVLTTGRQYLINDTAFDTLLFHKSLFETLLLLVAVLTSLGALSSGTLSKLKYFYCFNLENWGKYTQAIIMIH